MAIKKDLATLVGHKIPFDHEASGVVYDRPTNISVRDKLDSLQEEVDSSQVTNLSWDFWSGLGIPVYPSTVYAQGPSFLFSGSDLRGTPQEIVILARIETAGNFKLRVVDYKTGMVLE